MNNKTGISISIVLLILVGGLGLYLLAENLGKFLYYRDIVHSGISAEANIKEMGILIDGELINRESTVASDHHIFKAEYKTVNNLSETCIVSVSKSVYDSYTVSQSVSVVYLSSKPSKCLLEGSANGLYLMSLILIVLGGFVLLLFLALAFHVYKTFKKPDRPISLTEKFGNDLKTVDCPQCGREMEEGYIPGVGGINWRKKDEPVGLPSMISGLPGTVFWFKRPLLHAFNCKDCCLVIFKYRKK